MDILALMTGISPWWWIAVAILLFVAEMLTFTYFVIWIAAAAAAMGAVVFVSPGLGGGAQLAIFAVLSIAFTIAGRYVLARKRIGRPAPDAGLNQRAQRLIGRKSKAVDDFVGSDGAVEVDQIIWRARLTHGTALRGQLLTVTAADDMTLICEPEPPLK